MSMLMAKLLGRVLRGPNKDDGSGNGGAVGTGNEARVKLLNEINDGNDELNADQLLDVNDDGSTTPFTVKKTDGSEERLDADEKPVVPPIVDPDDPDAVAAEQARLAAEEAEAKRLEDEQQEAARKAGEEKHKIKINGKEIELSFEEILQRAQKVESADQYLAEAARLRSEMSAEKEKKLQKDNFDLQSDDALALARAIQMGSEEEAVEAIRKLQSKGPSSDDLAKTIDERLSFNEAISKFRTDFSDLVSDSRLYKLVLDKDAELIAAGDRRSYGERYDAIGKEIREWWKGTTESTRKEDPNKEDNLKKKEAQKAAAPSVPKSSSAKIDDAAKEEKEETDQEIIANMAKARGGPQWMQTGSQTR